MNIISQDIWKQIRSSAKLAKSRYVASAYLGSGASAILPLSKGDILIVDASIENIRAGNTNPEELLKYSKNGVYTYSWEGLHAKIFVFDNVSFVGSTNISKNSEHHLTELVIQSKAKSHARTLTGFIMSLAVEPLTPEYLKILLPAFRHYKKKRKRHGISKKKLKVNVWVQHIVDYEFTEAEEKTYKIGMKRAKTKIKNTKEYTIESVRYKKNDTLSKNGKLGDFMIILDRNDSGWAAYEPARILHLEHCKEDSSVLIYYEQQIDPIEVKWKVFKRTLERVGNFKVHQKMNRMFSKQDQKNAIMGLWKK